MRVLAVVSAIVAALGIVLWAARAGGPSSPAPTQTVPRSVSVWVLGIGLAGLCVAATWWAFNG